MSKELAKSFCVSFGFSSFCSVKNGGFNSPGEGFSEKFRGKLNGPENDHIVYCIVGVNNIRPISDASRTVRFV